MKFTCGRCKNEVETTDSNVPDTCLFCIDEEISGQLDPITQLFENTSKQTNK